MAMTLQQRLDDAETAYHELTLGRAPRELRDSNGETIAYTAANPARLLAYIDRLKAQISGVASGPMYLRCS